jgi:RNA polymerase sigma-70 factor (ECF subfamily)
MSLEQLLRACAEVGDGDAWREFISCFDSLIGAVVLKTARRWGEGSSETVSDLIQETYLKLCANRTRMLAEFESRHPDAFYGYIKVVTANVVNDHFRARHSQKRDVTREGSLQELATGLEDPGFGSPQQIERATLLAEVDAVLLDAARGTDVERDRAVFWLYYRQGMTAQAIAELPDMKLTAKGVESLIRRLTRQVRERLAGQRCLAQASGKGQGV